jgi:hypothetical protein
VAQEKLAASSLKILTNLGIRTFQETFMTGIFTSGKPLTPTRAPWSSAHAVAEVVENEGSQPT